MTTSLTPGTPLTHDQIVTLVDASKPITTREQLFAHLYQAAQLEMSSIPLYLYAGYSIKTQGYSQWSPGSGAFRLIKTVVIEEMLHLSLVRNLIVSIGFGELMWCANDTFLPTYPSPMLNRKPLLELRLGRCTPDLVRRVFMEFELPGKPGAPSQPNEYNTIGQFYKAIRDGFVRLCGLDPDAKNPGVPPKSAGDMHSKLFGNSQPDLQYIAAYWNEGGGGSPMLVRNLFDALWAINQIVEQGEGTDPDRKEVPKNPLNPVAGESEFPHYIKFQRIAEGIEQIGETWPVPDSPKLTQYEKDRPVHALATLFNAAYTYVMHLLDELYRTSWRDVKPGVRSRRYGLERQFVAAMQGLLFGIANLLVQTKITQGDHKGSHAAPTFEYYNFAQGSIVPQLRRLCDEAIPFFPALGGDNGVRWLIGQMPDLSMR